MVWSRVASCTLCSALKASTMEHRRVSQDFNPPPPHIRPLFSVIDLNAPFSVRVFLLLCFSFHCLLSCCSGPTNQEMFFFPPQAGIPGAERPAGVDRSPAKHTSAGRSVLSLHLDPLRTLNVHQTFMFIYVHADVCVLLSPSLKGWISSSTSRPLTDIFSVKEPHH